MASATMQLQTEMNSRRLSSVAKSRDAAAGIVNGGSEEIFAMSGSINGGGDH